MSETYTFVVDESGQAGIKKIRTSTQGGASPFMTLGGALVRDQTRQLIEDDLDRIAVKVGSTSIHCKEMRNHFKVTHCAREIAKLDIRLMGVISRKDTLGSYKEIIGESHSKYFNKCSQYILERLGLFLRDNNIDKSSVKIVFEEFNNDFGQLKNLIRSCQRNPHYEQTKLLRYVDVDRIEVKSKSEEPLLQLADVAAHALFKCVDKDPKQYGLSESRYFQELCSKFAAHPETKHVANYGLHCVHSIEDLKLDSEIAASLHEAKGAGSF